MGGKSRFSSAVQQEILKDYEAMRSSEVAAKYNINRKTVLTIVKRLGGDTKLQRLASGVKKMQVDAFLEKAIEMRDKGASQSVIGKALHVSQVVVSRIFIKAGIPSRRKLEGADSPYWKTGLTTTDAGYILEKVTTSDPYYGMSNRMGYVLQHRLVCARHFRRLLNKNETVHHINGNRSDNRIENLQIHNKNHGAGVILKCACCGSNNIIPSHIQED